MRVNAVVAVVVMPNDVIEINRLGDTGPLVQFARKRPKVAEIDKSRPIAFEMKMIDRVKPEKRRYQPPIGFSDAVAHQIAVLA